MKIIYVIILIFICTPVSYSQWAGGLSVNIKNEEPQKGLGFIIIRKLPIQTPLIGIDVRFEADQFNQRIPMTDLTERILNLSLSGTFFFKTFQPYVLFGPGYSFHSANDESSNSFLINLIGGVKLASIDPVYPFFEIKTLTYFSSLNKGESDSKKFQAAAALGVIFEF